MKTKFTFSTWVCCLLFLLSSACLAAPPFPLTPAAPPTLAQSLALAEPPKADLYLAVGADKLKLPAEAAPLPPNRTVAQTADAYGLMTQVFGGVWAITPPTMTVVYSPPATPNPYDGMPIGQVMRLLSKTFTLPQWKALLSPSGVGYTEMAEGEQRHLFEALFPEGHLIVIEDNPTGPNDPKTTRDITGEALTQTHLHLGYTTSIALQQNGKPDEHVFAGTLRPLGSPKSYFMTNEQSYGADHEFGAVVRATVPAALKLSDLKLDDSRLRVLVPLNGLKSVNDLVARISVLTRIELYADPRFARRSVTLIGPGKSAPAKDLLQGLAVCVAGAYRRIGPAYVLTDEVVGVGTRHALWKRFEEKAQEMLPDGNDIFAERIRPDIPYTVQDISWSGDQLAFTSDQQKQFWAKWKLSPGQSSSPTLQLTLPYSQLSPTQKVAADQTQLENEKSHLDTTLDGTVMLQAEPLLEITLPALDGKVLVFQSYQGLLPYPSLTQAEQAVNMKRFERDNPIFETSNAPAPIEPLKPILRQFDRRAVRIAPNTLGEAALALAAMKVVGFNELWVQMTPGLVGADEKALLLLKQVAEAGKAAGVVVCADLRLLHWETAPAALVDRDMSGRSQLQIDQSKPYKILGSHETVTPFAPEVGGRLSVLLRRIAAVPGLGGIVWDDLTPHGYELLSSSMGDFEPEAAMGFAEAGRLTSLRLNSVDPVDLYPNSSTDERANVKVPGFDDFAQEAQLYAQWQKLGSQTAREFAFRLARQIPTALPLFVPPANTSYTSLYGSWDDRALPPPVVHYTSHNGPDGLPVMGSRSIETMTSALSYRKLDVFVMPDATPQIWAAAAAGTIRLAAKQPDRNILLDVTAKPELLLELERCERKAGRALPAKP